MIKIPVHLTAIICGVGLVQGASAQTWNSFNDFWVDVPATGGAGTYPQTSWIADGGNTTPNTWNYAAGNLTGGAFPTQVGTYLSGGFRYGLTAGNTYTSSGQSWTFGPGNYYIGYDIQNWYDLQIGKYNYVWDNTVPGWSGAAGPNTGNLLWLRPMYLNQLSVDNSAAILEWIAPYSGTFDFSASFAPGNYLAFGGSTVSYAAVDSLGGVLISRQVVAQGSALQSYNFTDTLNAGDVVQFQVGAPSAVASPVGLMVQVTAVPEPGSLALSVMGLASFAWAIRKRGSLVKP